MTAAPPSEPMGEAPSGVEDPAVANGSSVPGLTFPELWYLARELYQAGEIAHARTAFEQAVRARPIDAGIRVWAGLAAYRLGDRDSAVSHWTRASESLVDPDRGMWISLALTASYLDSGEVEQAARLIIPLERGDGEAQSSGHPVVSFYAGMVYERLATVAPSYRDAVEESVAERFTPPLAAAAADSMASPNSKSWLLFLAKRCYQRTITEARTSDWWAVPVVPWQTTLEPSLTPTVEELLEALGSDDFANQASQKLRALRIYESESDRGIEFFDPEELFRTGRIAISACRDDLDS